MTTTYTPLWRLAILAPNDPTTENTWGAVQDATMALMEQGAVGNTAISINGLTTYTLTTANNSADQGRLAMYNFTGALAADCTVTIPTVARIGWVTNSTTGSHNVILTTGGGTTLTIPPGLTFFWTCDGTNVASVSLAASRLAVGTASTARLVDVRVGTTASSQNEVRIWGYQAALEVLNNAGTQNWYFGVNDGDNSNLYIGAGYSPGQGIVPSIKIVNGVGTVAMQGLAGGSNTMLQLNAPGGASATLQSIQTGTGTNTHLFFQNNNGTVGSISTSGTTTAYNTSSDARLKIDDGLISGVDAGRIVDRLRPRWFRFKSAPDAEPRPGFFAQQVARVFPWAVTKGHGRPERKNFRPWQMDAAALMPVVVAALQDARREIAELKRRLA